MNQIIRQGIVGILGVGTLLTACQSGNGAENSSAASRQPTVTAVTPASPGPRSDASCGRRVRFEPAYLPRRWIARLQAQGAGGIQFPGLVGQYGPDAMSTNLAARAGFADLVVGESPLAQTDAQPIHVLGRPATLGVIHEGFSVEFTFRGCDYALLAYGITRVELERLAMGLVLRGRS